MNQILKRINFAQRYNEVQPASFGGKALKDSHIRTLGNREITPLLTSNIINECLSSADNVLVSFAGDVVREINESAETQFRVGMLQEITKIAATKNQLLTVLSERLETLTDMEETVLSEALQNGVLSDFTWYPPAKELHEYYNKQAPKVTDSHTIYVPVSYIEMNEGKTYFNVEGKHLMLTSDGNVTLSDGATSREFNVINEAVSRLPYDPNKQEFFAQTLIGQAVINKDGDLFVGGVPCTLQMFNESMKDAITLNSGKIRADQMAAAAKVADDLVILHENFDNITELDRVRVAKSAVINESISCIVVEGNAYLLESSQYTNGQRFSKADSIREGLIKFESRTHYPLHECFIEDLTAETALFESEAAAQKEKQDAIALVESELYNCDPGSPRREELINLLESLQ